MYRVTLFNHYIDYPAANRYLTVYPMVTKSCAAARATKARGGNVVKRHAVVSSLKILNNPAILLFQRFSTCFSRDCVHTASCRLSTTLDRLASSARQTGASSVVPCQVLSRSIPWQSTQHNARRFTNPILAGNFPVPCRPPANGPPSV